MLQAWARSCILLVALAILPAAECSAERTDEDQETSGIQRMGEASVDTEYPLDLAMPLADEGMAAPTGDQAEASFEREMAIENHLTAAVQAERNGKFDQPPQDCAWFHYRSVLELDPGNAAAVAGLHRVQEAMITRAERYARDMDYESAERLLEDAALVLDDTSAVDTGYETIRNIRLEHAAELEIAAVSAMDSGDFEAAEQKLIELIALGDMDTTVSQLRRRLEEARVYGGFKPGQTIRDHFMGQATWTPESVIVAAGSFIMGSSTYEKGRKEHEGPTHRVTFRRGFAIGRTEVTVAQFRLFVEKTGYKTDAEKAGDSMAYDHRSGRLARRDKVSWRMNYEGREAVEDEPVVHVSWNDAHAYTRWLAQGTGKPYRLPSEAEFEYAVRAGRATRYWWGDGTPGRVVENLTGEGDVSRSQRQWSTYFDDYSDGHWGPAPVASFGSNPFGVYDLAGNVAEWVMDCWHETYLRAPTDGSAWVNPGCNERVIRGGYWASSPDQARSSSRIPGKSEHRDARVGFRIARDL